MNLTILWYFFHEIKLHWKITIEALHSNYASTDSMIHLSWQPPLFSLQPTGQLFGKIHPLLIGVLVEAAVKFLLSSFTDFDSLPEVEICAFLWECQFLREHKFIWVLYLVVNLDRLCCMASVWAYIWCSRPRFARMYSNQLDLRRGRCYLFQSD